MPAEISKAEMHCAKTLGTARNKLCRKPAIAQAERLGGAIQGSGRIIGNSAVTFSSILTRASIHRTVDLTGGSPAQGSAFFRNRLHGNRSAVPALSRPLRSTFFSALPPWYPNPFQSFTCATLPQAQGNRIWKSAASRIIGRAARSRNGRGSEAKYTDVAGPRLLAWFIPVMPREIWQSKSSVFWSKNAPASQPCFQMRLPCPQALFPPQLCRLILPNR